MTTMKSAQTVYEGPDNTFNQVGSVSSGESVTAMWQEGTWSYIKYQVGSSKFYKCGYVPTSSVSTASSTTFTPSFSTRYVGKSSVVFYGPNNWGYTNAGTITQKTSVQYTGKKDNNYALVQVGTRRYWISADNLSTTIPTTGGNATLSLPYNFQQNDTQWQDLNDRFGSDGCAVCCAADVASFAEGTSRSPAVMLTRGVFSENDITCHWYNASSYCSWQTNEYQNVSKTTYLEQIRCHISSGLPVVVKLKNTPHFVVAYGYVNGAQDTSDVYIRDPYSTQNTTLADALNSHNYNALYFIYFAK